MINYTKTATAPIHYHFLKLVSFSKKSLFNRHSTVSQRFFLLFLIGFLSFFNTAGAATLPHNTKTPVIQVKHLISPIRGTVGETFNYSLTITSNLNVAIIPIDPADLLSEFTILDQSIKTVGADKTRTTVISATFSNYDTGRFVIPTSSIDYSFSKKSYKKILRPLHLSVNRTTSTADMVLKESSPPFKLNISYGRYLIYLLCVIVLILIGIIVTLWIKKKQNKGLIIEDSEPVDPRQPWERALEKIQVIESTKLKSADQLKPLYFDLTEALKIYFSEIFDTGFVEKTTTEIIDMLDVYIDDQSIRRIRNLFEKTDLVKYTQTIPTKADHFEVLKKTKEIVIRLKTVAIDLKQKKEEAAVKAKERAKRKKEREDSKDFSSLPTKKKKIDTSPKRKRTKPAPAKTDSDKAPPS
ncbi:hypothetical protein HOG98_06295 [bacterium]|jgi:hypothetical protein|nr:hypothetical protein [bacterium]